MTPRAIETIYHGCRFRSRLEARWAVFFDALNMPWEYEKEGFDLDGTRYLPDFWLPFLHLWVEVKGQEPDDNDWLKIVRLARHTNQKVLVLIGNIDVVSQSRYILACEEASTREFAASFPDEVKTVPSGDTVICTPIAQWAQCPICSYVCLGFEARNRFFLFCNVCAAAKLNVSAKLDRHDPRTTEAMLYAYQAARSARFEGAR